ncbi:hypothetical protein Tco_1348704 [Tanacetum coccineum]
MDLMNRVYKPYLVKFVIVFIDDISIAQANKEYEEHLRLILGLLKNKELLLRLLSDFDCKIRYHPGKESIAADALSRNERAKPLRVRALVMTINSNLPPQIHEARVEALKKENIKGENLHGTDKEFGNHLDGTLCIRRRSWLPRIKDLG